MTDGLTHRLAALTGLALAAVVAIWWLGGTHRALDDGSDATRIGICGLIKRDSLDEVDLGFGFVPAYEGLGYGCESARSFLDLARHDLQLQRVASITPS